MKDFDIDSDQEDDMVKIGPRPPTAQSRRPSSSGGKKKDLQVGIFEQCSVVH